MKANLHTTKGCVNKTDEANIATIVRLVLHPLLFGKNSMAEDGLPNPKDVSVTNFIPTSFHDSSLTMKCVYALATGAQMPTAAALLREGHSYFRSNFLACYCDKEMLLRASPTRDSPRRLQKYVLDVIFSHTGNKKVIEVFSVLRLSTSKSHLNRSIDSAAVVSTLDEKYYSSILESLVFTRT